MERPKNMAPGLISSLEGMIEDAIESPLTRRFGSSTGPNIVQTEAVVDAALESRLGQDSSKLKAQIDASISTALNQRIGPIGSVMKAHISFGLPQTLNDECVCQGARSATIPGPEPDLEMKVEPESEGGTPQVEAEGTAGDSKGGILNDSNLTTEHGTIQERLSVSRASYEWPKQATNESNAGDRDYDSDSNWEVTKAHSRGIAIESQEAEEMEEDGEEDSEEEEEESLFVSPTDLQKAGSVPGSSRKRKMAEAEINTTEFQPMASQRLHYPGSSISTESDDLQATHQSRIQEQVASTSNPGQGNGPEKHTTTKKYERWSSCCPEYTSGPLIKYSKVCKQLTANQKSRNRPKVVDLSTFTNDSNKSSFTMADAVVTVLWKHSPGTLEAFLQNKSAFKFLRRGCEGRMQDLVIEKDKGASSVILVCGKDQMTTEFPLIETVVRVSFSKCRLHLV